MAHTTLKKNFWIILVILLVPCAAFANKTSVVIESPDKAALNSSIKIILHVNHKGNNFMHYTNWVNLKINGKEVQRWEFSSSKRPESEQFTREYTVTVEGPIKISAQGNCNLHGSDGVAEKSVSVQ